MENSFQNTLLSNSNKQSESFSVSDFSLVNLVDDLNLRIGAKMWSRITDVKFKRWYRTIPYML